MTTPRWKPSRAFSATRPSCFHPACAAAGHVGALQVLACVNGLPALQQFEHAFGQLHAGGPGLVHAGAGEHVGAAGAFADARVAVAGEERLAAPAGFLQRLGAPRPQLRRPSATATGTGAASSAAGSGRTCAPGCRTTTGTKMPTDGDAVRMHVEEAEDLGLREAEGVEDRAGFEVAALAAGPPPSSCRRPTRAGGGPRAGRSARRAGGRPRPPARRRPRSAAARMSMPGMKPASGLPCAVDALVHQAHAGDACRPRSAASATGVPGQICTAPVAISCAAHPLVELARCDMHQPAVLVQERRDVGQFEARGPARMPASRAARVGHAQRGASGGWRRSGRAGRPPSPAAPARPWGSAAGSRSGKLARMPRARVTTPETPKPMSSARS